MLVRGERLNGIQEVCGSIPHISTKQKGMAFAIPFCFIKTWLYKTIGLLRSALSTLYGSTQLTL